MSRRLPLPVLPLPIRIAGVLAVAAVIFYWSIWTVLPPAPTTPVPSPTPVDPSTPDLISLAQWRHLLSYLALGLSIAYALVVHDRHWLQKALIVVVVAASYGVLIELGQAVHTHRSFEFSDIAFNTLGAVLAMSWYAIEYVSEPIPVDEQLRRLRGIVE